ncbi:MAG TPA: PspC domain-containing protein [Mycobacteriales bacterium]|nr:PspC domain-containing protein [Mycobacteriales bacterium]
MSQSCSHGRDDRGRAHPAPARDRPRKGDPGQHPGRPLRRPRAVGATLDGCASRDRRSGAPPAAAGSPAWPAGVADHLRISVRLVRVIFVVLAATNGVGVLAYGLLWAFVPDDGGEVSWRRLRKRSIAAIAATAVVAISIHSIGGSLGFGTVWPLTLAVLGALLIWMRAEPERRAQWADDARRWGRFAASSRHSLDIALVAGGVVLVVGGIAGFLAAHDALRQARNGALAIGATAFGVALVCGPWLVRLARDLSRERRARIHEQERAEVAAHVHDSVLQTLTLLQRHAGDEDAVRRLARRQERDLRSWLYGARPSDDGQTFAAAMATTLADVEDAHGVLVELVLVGDAPIDDRLTALVAATREATVNAARHAQVAAIDVYAEVDEREVTVYVRDRGFGFDPVNVPDDRRGLRDSVRGRMRRAGGDVAVRTAPGEGTEVTLTVPRKKKADNANGAS